MLSRVRHRFIEVEAEHGGQPCKTLKGQPFSLDEGLEIDKKPCQVDVDTVPCPVVASQPYFAPWTPWTDCSSECSPDGHKSEQTRKRDCIGKANKKATGCKGQPVEKKECLSVCPPSKFLIL